MNLKTAANPVQVRAYDLAAALLDTAKKASTPEGRYILGRLYTKAKQAEQRAPKVAKKRAQRKANGGKTFSDWMHLADRVFSIYIRWRDTWDTVSGRTGRCATCKASRSFSDLQNGHWIRRENWGTRWHEWNCNPQDTVCNNYRGGEEEKHAAYIENRYGKGTCDRLRAIAKFKAKKPSELEVRGIVLVYATKLKELNYPGDLSEFFPAEGAVSASEPQQDSVTSTLPSPLPKQIHTQGVRP